MQHMQTSKMATGSAFSLQHLLQIGPIPDVPEIKAVFQQWQSLTIELMQTLAVFHGKPIQEDLAQHLVREKPNTQLRHYRKMHHWTQSRMADELYRLCDQEATGKQSRGVNATMVSNWERGKFKPCPFWQRKLCILFQTTPDCLGLA